MTLAEVSSNVEDLDDGKYVLYCLSHCLVILMLTILPLLYVIHFVMYVYTHGTYIAS